MTFNLLPLKFAGIWKVWMLSLRRCCLLQRWSSLLPTWNPMWYYAWSLCSRSGGHFISQFFPWKGKQQILWIDTKTNQRRWLCWARGIFTTVILFCSCWKKVNFTKNNDFFSWNQLFFLHHGIFQDKLYLCPFLYVEIKADFVNVLGGGSQFPCPNPEDQCLKGQTCCKIGNVNSKPSIFFPNFLVFSSKHNSIFRWFRIWMLSPEKRRLLCWSSSLLSWRNSLRSWTNYLL